MSPPYRPPEDDVLRADPRLRKLALIGFAIVVAVALAGFFALSRWMGRLELQGATDPRAAVTQLVRLVTGVATALGAGAALAGLYFFDLSRRTLASGRYPPPGTRVLSDTRILLGEAARRKARLGAILAVLLMLVGVAVPFVAARVVGAIAAREAAKPEVYSVVGSGIGRPKSASTFDATQAAVA